MSPELGMELRSSSDGEHKAEEPLMAVNCEIHGEPNTKQH